MAAAFRSFERARIPELSGICTKGDDGHLYTSKRTEAFDKIREFCRGPYQVLKEGKTKGRQRVVEGMGGAEIVTEDWWGIRFQCTK